MSSFMLALDPDDDEYNSDHDEDWAPKDEEEENDEVTTASEDDDDDNGNDLEESRDEGAEYGGSSQQETEDTNEQIGEEQVPHFHEMMVTRAQANLGVNENLNMPIFSAPFSRFLTDRTRQVEEENAIMKDVSEELSRLRNEHELQRNIWTEKKSRNRQLRAELDGVIASAHTYQSDLTRLLSSLTKVANVEIEETMSISSLTTLIGFLAQHNISKK
ncbi:hypothetical protein HDU76_003772 [Blyttiomyces sp. JEL0837]|nr:hypothetical protein HDU76_003772 [Blyttiomyces sp. JEL0837]